MQNMQTTCKSNATNATNAQNLGGGLRPPPKKGGGGLRPPPPLFGPKFCAFVAFVALLLHVVCMFCICFTFYLHFVCIAAGDDEAAAAAVAAAADAVDDAAAAPPAPAPKPIIFAGRCSLQGQKSWPKCVFYRF